MTKLLDYALPAAAALLLIVFFSGLPWLRRCVLPSPAGAADRGEALSSRAPIRIPEAVVVLTLSFIYAVFAFTGLGNTDSPQSFVNMKGREVDFTLLSEAPPSRVMLFTGVGVGSYELEYADENGETCVALRFEQSYAEVLKWQALTPQAPIRPQWVRLRCVSGDPWLGEVVFLDGDGQQIPVYTRETALADEPDTMPWAQHFMNSAYFDEIYHVRTAWEHLHGIWPYEISHPPLGKELIGLGIRLCGMTPFGWRFMGTLFGTLMLPVMYVFLKKLFGGRAVPTLGTLVFAAEFMHFVQTRIATVDTYGVFFILLMYLFYYVWASEGKLWALALSGISFGLGCASKWTAVYAGAGLGVLWLGHWLLRLLERRRAVRCEAAAPALSSDMAGDGAPDLPPGAGDGARACGIDAPAAPSAAVPSAAAENDDPKTENFFLNVLFCLVFFVLVPALIYYLSYLPYGRALGCSPFSGEYTRMVLDNQGFMFRYHAGIEAEHPYSSRWYQWLLDIRPILYYLEYYNDGSRSSIAAFVSPAVCWGGFMSLFVLLYMALFRRDRRAAFLLLGYLAQLLPWVFIKRLTFAYHYFPSSVFLVLAIGYVFALMRDNRRDFWLYAGGFTLASLLLFWVFWPALSGTPVDNQLGSAMMGWLPTWPILGLVG